MCIDLQHYIYRLFERKSHCFTCNSYTSLTFPPSSSLHPSQGHGEFLQMLCSLGANCHLRSAQSRGPIDLIPHSPLSTREERRRTLLIAEPRLRTLILHHEDCLERPHTKESDWDGADRLERILKELTDPLQVRPSLSHLICIFLSPLSLSPTCVSLSLSHLPSSLHISPPHACLSLACSLSPSHPSPLYLCFSVLDGV